MLHLHHTKPGRRRLTGESRGSIRVCPLCLLWRLWTSCQSSLGRIFVGCPLLRGPPHQCYRSSPIIDTGYQHDSLGSLSHKNASYLSRIIDFNGFGFHLLLLFGLKPLFEAFYPTLYCQISYHVSSWSRHLLRSVKAVKLKLVNIFCFLLVLYTLVHLIKKKQKNKVAFNYGMCACQWLHACDTRPDRTAAKIAANASICWIGCKYWYFTHWYFTFWSQIAVHLLVLFCSSVQQYSWKGKNADHPVLSEENCCLRNSFPLRWKPHFFFLFFLCKSFWLLNEDVSWYLCCRCHSLPGPLRPLNSMPSWAARKGFPVMSTSIALIVLWSKLDQHLLSSLRGVSPSCGS